MRIADVDKVEIVGERPRRIFVDISSKKLATLGIPASAIFKALQLRNTLVPAGSVDTPTERVTVKVDGAFANMDAVADAPIAVNGGPFASAMSRRSRADTRTCPPSSPISTATRRLPSLSA